MRGNLTSIDCIGQQVGMWLGLPQTEEVGWSACRCAGLLVLLGQAQHFTQGGKGEGLWASNNRLGFCWVSGSAMCGRRWAGHSLNAYNFVPYHGCCRTPQPPLLLVYRGFAMVGKLGRVNV